MKRVDNLTNHGGLIHTGPKHDTVIPCNFAKLNYRQGLKIRKRHANLLNKKNDRHAGEIKKLTRIQEKALYNPEEINHQTGKMFRKQKERDNPDMQTSLLE